MSSLELNNQFLKDSLSKILPSITNTAGKNLISVILFGSCSNNEFSGEPNDIDLCVLVRVFNPFLESRLKAALKNFPFDIGICVFPINYFRRTNTMMISDIKIAGKVIYGDQSVVTKGNTTQPQPYDAVRVFLNYGAVKMDSAISEEILKSTSLDKKQIAKISYCCMKAYEGIGAALLIQKRKYVSGYRARADRICQTYEEEFPELSERLPNFPSKLKSALKLRLRGEQAFGEEGKDLWFATRESVRVALPFIMGGYFGKNKNGIIDDIQRLNRLRHSYVSSILYSYRLFARSRRLVPARTFWVEPVTKVHIASTLVLFAFDQELAFQETILKLAEQEIGEVYPLNAKHLRDSIDRWDNLRRICVFLNEEGLVSQIGNAR